MLSWASIGIILKFVTIHAVCSKLCVFILCVYIHVECVCVCVCVCVYVCVCVCMCDVWVCAIVYLCQTVSFKLSYLLLWSGN